MFFCPHDPHFALLLAGAAEEAPPSRRAVVSVTATLAAVVLGIAFLL